MSSDWSPGTPCFFLSESGLWERGSIAEHDAALGIVICEGSEGIVEEVSVANLRVDDGETADDLIDIIAPNEGSVQWGAVHGEGEVTRAGGVVVFRNPHVFLDKYLPQNIATASSVADVARQALQELHASGDNQVITPLGTTSSGQSEVVKIILRALVSVGGLGTVLGAVNMVLDCFGVSQRVFEVRYCDMQPTSAVVEVPFYDVDSLRRGSVNPPHCFKLLGVGSYPEQYNVTTQGGGEGLFSSKDDQAAVEYAFEVLLGVAKYDVAGVFEGLAEVENLREESYSVEVTEKYLRVLETVLKHCNTALSQNNKNIPMNSIFVADLSGGFRNTTSANWSDFVSNTIQETAQRCYTRATLDRPYEAALREGVPLAPPDYVTNLQVISLLTGGNGVAAAVLEGASVPKRCFGNTLYTPPGEDDPRICIGSVSHTYTEVRYEIDRVVSFGDRNRFDTAMLQVEELYAMTPGQHWVRCIDVESDGVLSRQLDAAVLFPVVMMEKHGYPVSYTHQTFLKRYKPLYGLSSLDLGVTKIELSPERARAKVFSPLSSPRRHYGVAGVCEELITACLLGSEYSTKVTYDKVFLMTHAHRGLEKILEKIVAERVRVVQAFCKDHVKGVLKEKIRLGWAPVVEGVREGVRDVNELVLKKEPKGREVVEGEEVEGFVEVAKLFIEKYHAARVVVCEAAECGYREVIEEEWVEEGEEIHFLFTEHLTVQTHIDESRSRADYLEEEHSARYGIAAEAVPSFYSALLSEEAVEEDNYRRHVVEEEALWVSHLMDDFVVDAIPILVTEEEVSRPFIASEEADSWREVFDEISFVYLETAVEELVIEEELGRFGYRGVGGYVQDEIKSWKKITDERIPIELKYFTEKITAEHGYNETTARQVVEQNEFEERVNIMRRFTASLRPLKVVDCYKVSLGVREGIQRDEVVDRCAVVYAGKTVQIKLLVHGRGHESEGGHRKIVEKLQRDSVRGLLAVRRQFFAITNEEWCRGVLEVLEEAQRHEAVSRFVLTKSCLTTLSNAFVKFEVGKKKIFDSVRRRAHAMLHSDAQHDELIRRHYQTLRTKSARADANIATFLMR